MKSNIDLKVMIGKTFFVEFAMNWRLRSLSNKDVNFITGFPPLKFLAKEFFMKPVCWNVEKGILLTFVRSMSAGLLLL